MRSSRLTLLTGILAPAFGLVCTPALPSQSLLYSFSGDAPSEIYGGSVASAGDVNSDGHPDILVGAPQDDDNGTNAGRVQVLSGADGSVIYSLLGNSAGDGFGRSVAGAGDVNNDGVDDFIVGAEYDDINGYRSGSAWIYSGADGSLLRMWQGDADDYFGGSVAGVGDINQDGFDDVIVGAWRDDNTANNAGSAQVFSGSDGTVLFTFNGDSAGDALGFSGLCVASAGDVNADGIPDIIVGAPNADANGTDSGLARIYSGFDGSILRTLVGDSAGDWFGISVAGLGDVNLDGHADVIVGAWFDDDNGANSGSVRVYSGLDGSALYTVYGDSPDDEFGFATAGLGDLNSDGIPDFMVGASHDDNNGNNSGSARLFSGADGSVFATIDGIVANEQFGKFLATAGDVNQDGFDDFIVAAPYSNSQTGRVDVFSGAFLLIPADPDLSTIAATPLVVSAFGGQAAITVIPRDAQGQLLGSGRSVVITTSLGGLDPAVTDNLDGTYCQTLIGDGSPGTAVVSATIDGVALTSSASVALVPIDPMLSTIAVDPSTTYLGGHATVTVTPKDDVGQNAGPGLTVAIQTTLGTLVGTVQDHGDGTYSQGIDATALGTASITATVSGLALDTAASLAVLDPAAVGNVIGLQPSGTALGYCSIQQAVDDVCAMNLVKILVSPGTYEEIVHVKGISTALEFEALSSQGMVTLRGFKIEKSADVTIGYFDIDANDAGKQGIMVKGTQNDPTSVTVLNCLVHDTKTNKPGILLKGKATSTTLSGCHVFDCGGDGIEVRGEAALSISGCTIESNGDNGVYLAKNVVATIGSSTIRDNGLNGKDKRGYGVFRKRQGQGGAPQDVTLLGNTLSGNRGKVVSGSSDQDLGNYDQMIDATDDQTPY